MNAVYPVSDTGEPDRQERERAAGRLSAPDGSTLEDLARTIHSDLVMGLLYALDKRTGLHLPTDYALRDRDVLSLVSTARRG